LLNIHKLSRFVKKMNKIIVIKYHAINKSLIFASANINKMLEVSVISLKNFIYYS